MTRREFVSTVALPVFASNSPASLVVPVHQVIDTRARITPEQLQRFSSIIWPEAVQDFQRCGIQLRTTQESLAIRRSPGGRPVFSGLKHGVINFFITDNIPMDWDNGRGLAGVTTSYEGYHLCMIALNYAHGHQIPFFSVNTCVHELLHVLLGDVYESAPRSYPVPGANFESIRMQRGCGYSMTDPPLGKRLRLISITESLQRLFKSAGKFSQHLVVGSGDQHEILVLMKRHRAPFHAPFLQCFEGSGIARHFENGNGEFCGPLVYRPARLLASKLAHYFGNVVLRLARNELPDRIDGDRERLPGRLVASHREHQKENQQAASHNICHSPMLNLVGALISVPRRPTLKCPF